MSAPSALQRRLPELALTALSIVTAVSLVRVFPGVSFLPRMVAVCLLGHGLAMALRALRVPGWLAVPGALAVVTTFVSHLYYPGTQWALLPTGTTLSLARADLVDAWQQVGGVVPPVSAFGGFGLAAALALGIAAVTADTFAFRAHGRVEALVPTGVVFVAVSAVGIDRGRVAVTVLWLATALVVIAVSRATDAMSAGSWVGRRSGGAWVRWVAGGTVVAIAASLVAGMVGPRLPGAGAEPLLDPDVRDGDGASQIVSPLVDIRGRLSNRSDTVLFTVTADQPQYWRLSGLPEFDGTVWGIPDKALDSAGGSLSDPQPYGTPVVQRFLVQALGGNLAPAALTPTELRSTTLDLYFVRDTSTLVVPGDGIESGDAYEIVSSAATPPPRVLQRATALTPPAPTYRQLPDDWPIDLTRTARAIVGDTATPYERARRLQDWFRDNFRYDLDVPSGHSVDAINEFLDRRAGYCEQFAGTYAAFARAVGLPSRVAVGFTTGERGGDGRYRVRSRHAHAWPEVWFDGIGWVIFEPTPGRGAPGAEGYTGVPAEQDDTRAQDADPVVASTTTVVSGQNGATPSTTAPLTPNDPTSDETAPTPTSGPSPASPVGKVLLGLVTLVALWMWLMPIAVAAVVRRRRPAPEVVRTWNRTLMAVSLGGVRTVPSETPLESARRVGNQTGIDRHELTELASATTCAVYSETPLDEATETRCRTIGRHVLDSARRIMPWHVRLRARLDPRLAWKVHAG